MTKYLFKVEQAISAGENLHVIADTLSSVVDYRHGDLLEFHKPDGSKFRSKSNLVMIDAVSDYPLVVSLPNLQPDDIPIGTEVWLVDTNRKPLKPSRHFQPIP